MLDSMRLLGNPLFRPRRNRRVSFQTAPSPKRLGLGSKLLQRIHRDPIVERALIGCMQENPISNNDISLPSSLLCPHHLPSPFSPHRLGKIDSKRGVGGLKAYFGTTGSSFVLAASMASFHRAVHKHHLQPSFSPGTERRLFPREALKSRNSLVRRPATAWF